MLFTGQNENVILLLVTTHCNLLLKLQIDYLILFISNTVFILLKFNSKISPKSLSDVVYNFQCGLCDELKWSKF